jgi:hypothetical protein
MKKILSLVLVTAVAIFAGCKKSETPSADNGSSAPKKKLTIALLQKSKGNAYFIS